MGGGQIITVACHGKSRAAYRVSRPGTGVAARGPHQHQLSAHVVQLGRHGRWAAGAARGSRSTRNRGSGRVNGVTAREGETEQAEGDLDERGSQGAVARGVKHSADSLCHRGTRFSHPVPRAENFHLFPLAGGGLRDAVRGRIGSRPEEKAVTCRRVTALQVGRLWSAVARDRFGAGAVATARGGGLGRAVAGEGLRDAVRGRIGSRPEGESGDVSPHSKRGGYGVRSHETALGQAPSRRRGAGGAGMGAGGIEQKAVSCRRAPALLKRTSGSLGLFRRAASCRFPSCSIGVAASLRAGVPDPS